MRGVHTNICKTMAWDAVRLTLKVGFICPFVVNDPTNLDATIVVAQALCLKIFDLFPTQKTCLFTNGNKANVSAKPLSWCGSLAAQASTLLRRCTHLWLQKGSCCRTQTCQPEQRAGRLWQMPGGSNGVDVEGLGWCRSRSWTGRCLPG